MNKEQIKAINDAMSFLASMEHMDPDLVLYPGIEKHGKALENAKVPSDITDHFYTIAYQGYADISAWYY